MDACGAPAFFSFLRAVSEQSLRLYGQAGFKHQFPAAGDSEVKMMYV